MLARLHYFRSRLHSESMSRSYTLLRRPGAGRGSRGSLQGTEGATRGAGLKVYGRWAGRGWRPDARAAEHHFLRTIGPAAGDGARCRGAQRRPSLPCPVLPCPRVVLWYPSPSPAAVPPSPPLRGSDTATEQTRQSWLKWPLPPTGRGTGTERGGRGGEDDQRVSQSPYFSVAGMVS